jgi:hypothetical protein
VLGKVEVAFSGRFFYYQRARYFFAADVLTALTTTQQDAQAEGEYRIAQRFYAYDVGSYAARTAYPGHSKMRKKIRSANKG